MDRAPALVVIDTGATGALDPVLLLQAAQEALVDVGVRGVPDGEIIATFGRDTVAAFDGLVAVRGQGWPVAMQAARVFAARVVRDLAERRHPPAREADRGLRRLHAAGVAVALVSDLPTPVVDAVLLRHGWRRLVRSSLSIDRVDLDRPAPDVIDEAMARIGLRQGSLVANVAAHHAHLRAGRAAEVGCNVAVGWTVETPTGADLADIVAPHLDAAVSRLLGGVLSSRAVTGSNAR